MTSNLLLILTLNAIQISCNIKLIDQNNEAVITADCLVEAAGILGKRKVAVEYSKRYEDLASEILRKIKSPVVLNAAQTRKPTGIEHRTSNDLMIILNKTDPGRILNHTLWNGETRFLIVSQESEDIQAYFLEFWKHKVINVFALVPEFGFITAYSYLPYRMENCSMTETLVVDKCYGGKFAKKGSAFKDPIRIKNMNRCSVSITVNDAKPAVIFNRQEQRATSSTIEGYEGDFIEVVSKELNYTPAYKLADDNINWGWIHPIPHGTVGEVYTGVSDMAIGMLAELLERYESLDISTTYNKEECVTYGVAKGFGRRNPAWITIFVSDFSFLIWALITFSFLLISVNMWLINRYSRTKWFADKTDLVVSVFSSCLGSPIKIPDHTSAKISAAFWIFFGFVITLAYKASMGSKLAVPPPEPDIKTYAELLDSDLEITGLQTLYQVVNHSDDSVYRRMRKRYQYTNHSIKDAVELIANREKIAYLGHRTSFLYYSLLNPKARGQIHLINDCAIFFLPMVLLKKFSPFTNKVNQIISRLEESGIMGMWRSKYQYKFTPAQQPFHKLSNDQMFGVYCILFLGYALAFVCFLCEYFSRFRPSKKT